MMIAPARKDMFLLRQSAGEVPVSVPVEEEIGFFFEMHVFIPDFQAVEPHAEAV
jgi:hypothetical protein